MEQCATRRYMKCHDTGQRNVGKSNRENGLQNDGNEWFHIRGCELVE